MLGKKETVPAEIIDTLIGAGTYFSGTIVSHGTLRIDGRVEGEILTPGDVIIGESGRVLAQIHARDIIIVGKVKGNLVPGGRVELAAAGKLEGDIQVEPTVGQAASPQVGTEPVSPGKAEK